MPPSDTEALAREAQTATVRLMVRAHLPDKSTGQISRMLRRLRCRGLVKKIGRTYKYYVTSAGRKLKTLVLIPELARAMAA